MSFNPPSWGNLKARITALLCVLEMLFMLSHKATADCGKIIIIQIPPGLNINDLLGGKGLPDDQGQPSDEPPPSAVEPEPSDDITDDESDEDLEGEVDDVPGGDSADEVVTTALRYKANPKVFREPVQRGLIGWNGKEELLILSTQEQAIGQGKQTIMLSFMPLPGKCHSIKESEVAVINKAHSTIQNKLPGRKWTLARGLQLETIIGPHRIFVWKVKDRTEFANDVQSYIRKISRGKAAALFTADTIKVLDEYFDRGHRYFAFDVIDMSLGEVSEKRAIAYHFNAKNLYYPLRVSQSGGTGETRISLAVFTNGRKHKFAGLPFKQVTRVGDQTVSVTSEELDSIYPALAKLMGKEGADARIWEINGALDSFSHDLIVANP
jgi:hypothetical protein